MSDKLSLSVGLAHELEMAFSRNGWTNTEIKALCEGDVLAGVRNVVRGVDEIKPVDLLIDCDTIPPVPYGLRIDEHRKNGILAWDPSKIEFYLSSEQWKGKCIKGKKLRRELADMPVLNVNVLNYLMVHPMLIPDNWRKDERGDTRYISFWGTIYRDSDGELFVKSLFWKDREWSWNFNWLDGVWRYYDPAAVLVS
jgi:hypothetical protein